VLKVEGRGSRVAAAIPVALGILALVGELPVLRSLATADLNWCYRYLLPDSYDWIHNGLYWAGADLTPSLRPPGLPLLIALLWRLGALRFLPVLNFLALGACAALLYRLLRTRHAPVVAAVATWVFFSSAYVQELAKYVMAEVWATPFLVAAALAFLRAGTRPRAYLALGALLGAGYLVHYAAAIAGAGFAAAVLLTRRDDLKRRELWLGSLLACLPPLAWLLFRSLQYRARPELPTHVIEPLVSFSLVNIRAYLVTGAALLGLALLPLYAAGLLELLARRGPDPYRTAVLAPLLALLFFFGLWYRWVDKRFLFYAYPFAVCLLAQGLQDLVAWAGRARAATVIAALYLPCALAWNQIRYPAPGLGQEFLALTPRDFLDLAFHIEGARVTRVHPRLADAWSGGLFDDRLAPEPCPAGELPELLRIKADLDHRLPRGEPVGFHSGPGWPSDYWSAVNRLGNVLLRPVVRPDQARHAVAMGEVPGARELSSAGRYRVLVRE